MVEAVGNNAKLKQSRRRSRFADIIIRLVKEKPLGTVGGVIVLIFILTAIVAYFLPTNLMSEVHLGNLAEGPSTRFIMGTDQLGRDEFMRLIFGTKISITVGLLSSALSVLVSTAIGSISGLIGGKTDMIIQRVVDAWMCFPALFILMTLMNVVGAGVAQMIIVLGIATGISGSRVIRSAVIGIRANVYVEASTAIGCTNWQALTRHILPNIMAPVIILFTIGIGGMVLAEATLTFLGFGLPPDVASWGRMLNDATRQALQAPLLSLWPGLALSLLVYGINMLGDAVRDILDPRLRGGVGRYQGVKVKKLKHKSETQEMT